MGKDIYPDVEEYDVGTSAAHLVPAHPRMLERYIEPDDSVIHFSSYPKSTHHAQRYLRRPLYRLRRFR